MKKNNLMSYIALGIVFALFNVIAFVIPTEKTATFWIAYAFTVVAFLAQIPLFSIVSSEKELKSKFLNIPVVHIGISYLTVQLFAFAVFMIFPSLPAWLAAVVCSVILAVFALCAIGGQIGANEIEKVEKKVKIKRAFIQLLLVDVEMLYESEENADSKAALKKLAEDIRFSDPMSNELLGELESRICAKVDELKITEDKLALISEIVLLIKERNKKCKILK